MGIKNEIVKKEKKTVETEEDQETDLVNKFKTDVENHEKKLESEVKGLRSEIMDMKNNVIQGAVNIVKNITEKVEINEDNREKKIVEKIKKTSKTTYKKE